MADHKGGLGITGTRAMCRGRFVQDCGKSSGHMEMGVLFSLLLSRAAWVLYGDIQTVHGFVLLLLQAMKFIPSGAHSGDYS